MGAICRAHRSRSCRLSFAAMPEWQGHFGLVADTLVAAQNHRGAGQVERLLRLPLETLIRHGIRYITLLLQANGHLLTEDQVRKAAEKAELKKLVEARWAPVLGGEPFGSKLGKIRARATWRVEELSSLDALRAEGEAMGHCVARYAHRCRSSELGVRRLLCTGWEGAER